MFILDSHCDTPSQILRLRDLSIDNEYAHVDFPKLKRGGVDAAFFALYIPAALDSDPSKAYEYAMKLLDGVDRSIASNPSIAALAVSEDDAVCNKYNGQFSVFIGLENASPIDSLEKVKILYDKGVRYITLCHSANNAICDSCAPKIKKWGGLSPFGKELVAEMNRLGMLVDVSHVSDDTFYDVIKYSIKPVVATHSCCRALCNHPRNMTDDMIRALAAAGGVIQINFYPLFLDDTFAKVLSDSGIEERGELIEKEFIADPGNAAKRAAWNAVQAELLALPRPSYKLIADHIDYVVSLVGIDHVGIGSDYDGIEVTPDGMEDVSMMPKLFEELRIRGYSEADLAKIASENFFRVLNK
ncbi:MAG: dipeptidase [Bacteroidales bacterium]|nr:dipeptidase [Bacteroidales bacterium]